jgi:IS5 family transposase
MRQNRKGKQWYFGLKAHIGVDAKQGVVHTLVTTSANVSDSTVLPAIRARRKRSERLLPKAQDMTCRRTKFKHYADELQKKKNRRKSSVRAKVEHPFRIPEACLRLRQGEIPRAR